MPTQPVNAIAKPTWIQVGPKNIGPGLNLSKPVKTNSPGLKTDIIDPWEAGMKIVTKNHTSDPKPSNPVGHREIGDILQGHLMQFAGFLELANLKPEEVEFRFALGNNDTTIEGAYATLGVTKPSLTLAGLVPAPIHSGTEAITPVETAMAKYLAKPRVVKTITFQDGLNRVFKHLGLGTIHGETLPAILTTPSGLTVATASMVHTLTKS